MASAGALVSGSGCVVRSGSMLPLASMLGGRPRTGSGGGEPPTGAVYVPVGTSSMTFVIRRDRVESLKDVDSFPSDDRRSPPVDAWPEHSPPRPEVLDGATVLLERHQGGTGPGQAHPEPSAAEVLEQRPSPRDQRKPIALVEAVLERFGEQLGPRGQGQ